MNENTRMTRIVRDPEGLSGAAFDVIVVGGGIYGAMLLLEATRAGLRALLLERGDFGGATSTSHFRIGHGGLRYLQSLNLGRFRRAVRERRWLLRTFPDLVEPLRCVMPLYGEGLRRPAILRVALWINDALSADRNRGMPAGRRLGRGTVIRMPETLERFPSVRPEGLQGAAVWQDTRFRHANRILIEAIRWACEYGGRAQNYVEATEVTTQGGGAAQKSGSAAVTGVVAIDRESGRECVYHAPTVINATGPWAREFARRVDRDYPELFRKSKAWNVVFDRPPLGDGALAVKAPGPEGRTYFVQERGGRLFVGTGHAPCGPEEEDPGAEDPRPSEGQLVGFIDDINRALPALGLVRADVERVYAGFLPAREEGTIELAEEPVWVDHGRRGGPEGLYSVSGVKYTTARHVAERVVQRIQGRVQERAATRPASSQFASSGPASSQFASSQFGYDGSRTVRTDYRLSRAVTDEHAASNGRVGSDWRAACKAMIREEAVQHLDDLMLRRSDLGDYPDRARTLVDEIVSFFPWDTARKERERARFFEQIDTSISSCV